jgi:hypothetical protein
MSAWIVSKAHIDALVHALGRREMLPDHPDLVGRMLWRENVKSIHARYPDTELNDANYPGPIDFKAATVDAYAFTTPPVDWNPSQLLHHIGCYDYQSCEHEEWESSASYALMRDLAAALEREGGDRDKVDRDTTPWGVPDCGYTHSDWQTCAEAACPSVKADA